MGDPLAFLASALFVLKRLFSRRGDGSSIDVLLVVLALYLAVLVRLLILAMIDVSAFPAIDPEYLAPAYGILLVAVSLSILGPGRGYEAIPE